MDRRKFLGSAAVLPIAAVAVAGNSTPVEPEFKLSIDPRYRPWLMDFGGAPASYWVLARLEACVGQQRRQDVVFVAGPDLYAELKTLRASVAMFSKPEYVERIWQFRIESDDAVPRGRLVVALPDSDGIYRPFVVGYGLYVPTLPGIGEHS